MLYTCCIADPKRAEAYAFKKIEESLLKKERLLVLVPAQASFLLERQIISRCAAPGLFDVRVMSFEKLMGELFETEGGAARREIDETGRCMLAYQAIAQGGLKIIDAEKDPKAPALAARLIGALKAEKIEPETLEGCAREAGGALGQKLLDLSEIYRRMEARRGETLDQSDREAAAAALVYRARMLEDTKLLIFGFDLFSERRLELIEKLAQRAEITLILNAEEGNPLYEGQNALAQRLSGFSKTTWNQGEEARPAALSHLYKNLFAHPPEPFFSAPEGITFLCAQDRRAEAEAVAAQILELICKKSFRPREIAVLAQHPAEYESELLAAFTKNGLPFFFESKRSVAQSRLAGFVLSALDIFGKWGKRDVLRHLKTGYLSLSQQETDLLLGDAKTYGVKGFQFKKPFLKKELQKAAEPLRARAFQPLAAAETRIREGESAIDALLNYLLELNVQKQLEEEAQRLLEAGMTREARFTEQLYKKVEGLLAQARLLLPKDVSSAQLRNLLAAGFEGTGVAVVPPMADEVTLGDLTHSVLLGVRAVFVMGANDGRLLVPQEGSDLLNDYETQLLKGRVKGFPAKLAPQEQKAYLQRAISETFCLSWNKGDGPPAFLTDTVRRIFPQAPVLEEIAPKTPEAGLLALASEIRALEFEGEPTLLPSYIRDARGRELLRRLLPFAQRPNEATALPRALAAKLYGGLSGSASVIEGYYRCPYRHFVDYGLRPQRILPYEESAADAGTYVHALFDRFSKGLKREAKRWETLSDEEIAQRFAGAAEAEAEGHNRGILKEDARGAYYEAYLREESVCAARAIREQLSGTQINRIETEVGFGRGGEFLVQTPMGAIALRGKIDRADFAVVDGRQMVRVVDYKTGNKSFTLEELAYGLNLQLMIYLIALCGAQGEKGLQPAGGFYFRLELPWREAEKPAGPEFRMAGFLVCAPKVQGAFDPIKEGKPMSMNLSGGVFSREEVEKLLGYTKQLISAAAGNIFSGKLEICPTQKDGRLACEYCDYRGICRFDEEENRFRVVEKIDRKAFFGEEKA